jgi:lipopolysaccharide transport system ATP-binding protein
MPPIIEIHKLGKKYSVKQVQPYLALRDVVSEKIKNVFAKKEKHSNEFWALRDINFTIEKGERIGIIGRNGAGKSTLLKILSKITPPTTGEIKLNGRVVSLLEVGTGFHPELTGKENIYLNGSILGLTKKEINQKLDEIIDFSGVEKFIDTPLKHYSSGMQLRLAFSVAAHLEPEILLIDEVLAVGDIDFQRKCIGKMEAISKTSGRTILFVSHNLGFVQNFCTSTILLDKGKQIVFDKTNEVIESYLKLVIKKKGEIDSLGDGAVLVREFQIKVSGRTTDVLALGYPATFEIEFEALQNLNNVEIAFNIKDVNKELVSHITSLDKSVSIKAKAGEKIKATIESAQVNFTPGNYSIDLFVLNNNEMCWGLEEFTEFTVINSDKALRPNGFPSHVKFFTDSKWRLEKL